MGKLKFVILQLLCLVFISCDDEDAKTGNIIPGIHTFNSGLTFENLLISSGGQEISRSGKLTFKPMSTHLIVGGTRKLVFYGNDTIGSGSLAAGSMFSLIIPELVGNKNYKAGDVITTSELEDYYPAPANSALSFISGDVVVKALNYPLPVEDTYVILEFRTALYKTEESGDAQKCVELNGTLDF